MPGDPDCPKCDGDGHIILDALTTQRCGCLLRRLFSQKMGYVIWNSKIALKSKLVSKLEENLLLIYDDVDINPHLKLAFIHLGLDSNWLYIDDSNVLQAWLGKPNLARAENLYDIIEKPFLLLRLGTVGYPNKALPGVICELLIGRVLSGRPTWVVSPREMRPETCREYSDELMSLLNQHFELIRAGTTKTRDSLVVATSTKPKTQKPAETVAENASANDMLRQMRNKK